MSIEKAKKQELIEKYRLSDNDTGSVEVQCAIMTERILNLTDHFKQNPKDFQSRRGLVVLVNQRRRLLKYLKATDVARHKVIIQKLGLRK